DTLPPAIGNARPTVALAPAFGDDDGVRYQVRVNNESWPAQWSATPLWTPPAPLPEGLDTLEARARDADGNTQSIPTPLVVRVDTEVPLPRILEPSERQRIAPIMVVRGVVPPKRFRQYDLFLRRAGSADWKLIAHE